MGGDWSDPLMYSGDCSLAEFYPCLCLCQIAPHPVVRKVVVKGSDVLPTSLIQKETKPLISKKLKSSMLVFPGKICSCHRRVHELVFLSNRCNQERRERPTMSAERHCCMRQKNKMTCSTYLYCKQTTAGVDNYKSQQLTKWTKLSDCLRLLGLSILCCIPLTLRQ